MQQRDTDYVQVAEIYRDALNRWEPPLRAVAERLGIPYTTAIGRVRAAKKLGLLDPDDRRYRLVDKRHNDGDV